jgi:hypothetical protein
MASQGGDGTTREVEGRQLSSEEVSGILYHLMPT